MNWGPNFALWRQGGRFYTMRPAMNPVVNIAAYKFLPLDHLKVLRTRLQELCADAGLKGSILLSPEGINLFVAGSEPFISADLGSVLAPQKAGYNFTMGAGAGNAVGPTDCLPAANPTNSTYYATAIPQTFGSTGTRSFAVNAGNTIWQVNAAAAPAEPFAAPATPIQ